MSNLRRTAIGRLFSKPHGKSRPEAELLSPELNLQAFPQSLAPETLDDIADTYEGLWMAIQAAHDAGECSKEAIRFQVDRLRKLADRIDTKPTDEAIRAEADAFDRMARRAARSSDSASAQYIRMQCHLRFAAAVIIANHRRGF